MLENIFEKLALCQIVSLLYFSPIAASGETSSHEPMFGRWSVSTSVDSMSDVVTYLAINKSHLGESPVAGIASLIVGCHKPNDSKLKEDIFALLPTVQSSGSWRHLLYRIDKQKMVEPKIVLTRGMVFFTVSAFEFRNSRQIVIRISDALDQDFTFNFDASGTTDALSYIHGRCGK